jgi:hypothetical protein
MTVQVCRLNCCWSSPAQSSPRQVSVKWGLLCDEGRGSALQCRRYVCCTVVLTHWLLNCCWPSPAQWFLVPSLTGLMVIFYCLMAVRAFRPLTHIPLSSVTFQNGNSFISRRKVNIWVETFKGGRTSVDVELPVRPSNVTCCEVKKQTSHRIRDNWRISTEKKNGFDMDSYGRKRSKIGASTENILFWWK